MPSPFPGMNPFLERDDAWPDLHHRLIDRLAEALADQVDPRYLVRIEEQLYVQDVPESPHRVGPRDDVSPCFRLPRGMSWPEEREQNPRGVIDFADSVKKEDKLGVSSHFAR